MGEVEESYVLDLEGVADMKQNDEIWLVLVRRVRGYVDDEDVLKRPYLILIYEIAPNTILRNHKILLEHRLGTFPNPKYVLSMLIETMKKTIDNASLKSPPHRPKSVIFTSRYLHDILAKDVTKMKVLPKYWTEEENQGFGDDFLVDISKQLVEKKGFGVGKASFKPGILKTTNVTPEIGAGLWKAAAEFYKAKPWKTFADNQVFTISWKEEVRLFTVTGRHMEPGIIMEREWKDMRSLLETSKKEIVDPANDYYCALLFTGEEGVPFEDLEAAERYEWPLATRTINNSDYKKPKEGEEDTTQCFPVPLAFPSTPNDIEEMIRPKRWELLWFEVALRAIAHFTAEFNKDDSKTDAKFLVPLHTGRSAVKVAYWPGGPETWNDLSDYVKHEKVNVTQASLACIVCNKLEDNTNIILKKCGNCKKKLYCSRECQSSDWRTHKLKCTPPPATPAATTTPSS